MLRAVRPTALALLVCVLGSEAESDLVAQQPEGEWSSTGGTLAYTRYSPLDQIRAENVGGLEILWRRAAIDPANIGTDVPSIWSSYLMSTPVLLDGVLYAPNGVGYVEAFDPGTGATLWVQAPDDQERTGRSTRGIDSWVDDDGRRRIFSIRREYLYALDAETGERVREFGEGGGLLLRPPGAERYHGTSGPIVVGDVIVVAGNNDGAGDGGAVKEANPEDVRGFDARTGRLLWTFHVVPREGEVGLETWENDAWRYSGDLGAWCCLSADEELGYVYVPLTAPTSAWYGGHRPGDNLFSNTLVALDARTGARAWHFQMVHHDLWEYDNVGPPILGEITVDGRNIPAVMQPNKNGFLYVFDRRTGQPVWPIVERPVPRSTVPGERASPTQPFPTKPPAFDRQGVTRDDLIDFTPELRARALALADSFVLGPLYTPPSLVSDQPGGTLGTLIAPGGWGAANWNTGAFDPETGVYYAVSHTLPGVYGLSRPASPDATMEYSLNQNPDLVIPRPEIDGLPIVKPPWGRITALDLNRGEELWMVANGDGPRDHPLLRGLNLPPLGVPGRPVPLLTRSLLFLGEGSEAVDGMAREGMSGLMFRAYDKATGRAVWATELPAGTTGGPMTYMHEGRQYVVVPIGGREHPAEWVAFGLPPDGPPTR